MSTVTTKFSTGPAFLVRKIDAEMKPCSICKGKRKVRLHPDFHGEDFWQTCYTCNGLGEVYSHESRWVVETCEIDKITITIYAPENNASPTIRYAVYHGDFRWHPTWISEESNELFFTREEAEVEMNIRKERERKYIESQHAAPDDN